MQYLTINRCEDEPHIELLEKAEVEKRLAGEWNGYTIIQTLPSDLNYFPSRSVFVFGGEIVIPKQVAIATKWEL